MYREINSIDGALDEIKKMKPNGYDTAEPYLKQLIAKMGTPVSFEDKRVTSSWGGGFGRRGWRRQYSKTHLEMKTSVYIGTPENPRPYADFVAKIYPNSYMEFRNAMSNYKTRDPAKGVKLFDFACLMLRNKKSCMDKQVVDKYCRGKMTDDQVLGTLTLLELKQDTRPSVIDDLPF